MLVDLRRIFPGKYQLADVLGAPETTLRYWETGFKHPSKAGRRAVWLLWCLVYAPARLETVFDVTTWGRFRRERPRRARPQAASFARVADDWMI